MFVSNFESCLNPFYEMMSESNVCICVWVGGGNSRADILFYCRKERKKMKFQKFNGISLNVYMLCILSVKLFQQYDITKPDICSCKKLYLFAHRKK